MAMTPEERQKRQRESQRIYERSSAGKAAKKRYTKGAKGKSTQRRYATTPKATQHWINGILNDPATYANW